MQFRSSDINAMDARRRAAFVNSLSDFKSANLVGTANAPRRRDAPNPTCHRAY